MSYGQKLFVAVLLGLIAYGLFAQGGAKTLKGALTLEKLVTKNTGYGDCETQGIVRNTGTISLYPVLLSFRWMDGANFKGYNEVATDNFTIPVGGETTFDIPGPCASFGKTYQLTAKDASGVIDVTIDSDAVTKPNIIAKHRRHRHTQ